MEKRNTMMESRLGLPSNKVFLSFPFFSFHCCIKVKPKNSLIQRNLRKIFGKEEKDQEERERNREKKEESGK